ncbi:MAG: hypothetical protein EOO87_02200 [Pedobacter sp.]|nr:MAG: hypothetical protein EOO87_02200 [Pedobacter sp.]
MQKFTVQIHEKTLTIQPKESGSFTIIDKGTKLGTIYPEPGDLQLEWRSDDPLKEDFISKIGELITLHNLGKTTL